MALWRLAVADYLCLHELLERLRLFVRNNAKVPLLDALLSATKRFGVAMVPVIVASKCARHLGAVPSSVWQRQDPSFLTRVLSCARPPCRAALDGQRTTLQKAPTPTSPLSPTTTPF